MLFIVGKQTRVLWNNVVYLKEGIEVNESFRAIMPDGTTKTKAESIYAISNYEHEYYLNEKEETDCNSSLFYMWLILWLKRLRN